MSGSTRTQVSPLILRTGGALLVLLAMAPGIAVAAESRRERASQLFEQRKFADAATALEEHLEAHSDDSASRMLLGLCQYQLGDHFGAEATLALVVRAEPRNPRARFYLGMARYFLGRMADAESDTRAAMALGLEKGRGDHLLGMIYEERRQFEHALSYYLAAIRADPSGAAERHLSAGTILIKLGKATDAVGHLESAVSLRPDFAEAHYRLGLAHLELGEPSRARRALRQAVDLGNLPSARSLLARLDAGLPGGPGTRPSALAALTPIRFRNVGGQAGLRAKLENSPTSEKYLVETMAGGVAVFDFDGDGLTDIFLANGALTPSLRKEDPKYFNRLYRNVGGLRFEDVTANAALQGTGFSIGAATADYDNDGDVDLFVAGMGTRTLYRNRGDGTFDDVSEAAGLNAGLWSVGGEWLDFDRDGFLDLFVVNYLDWSPVDNRYCGDESSGIRTYCHPKFFAGLPNTLYRNRGDGSFEDISEQTGIAASIGKGMSTAVADYDDDGFPDIFVANDAIPNFLFRNLEGKAFAEIALEAGVALTDDGTAVSGMGSDFQDYDNDGRPDIVFTALAGETFPTFRNVGHGIFRDVTFSSGLGILSSPYSGWGIALADLNNDGWKDLFTANSHVMDNIESFSEEQYRQTNRIFANRGDGTFADVSDDSGIGLANPRAHRGVAYADFDNDGRLDMVVTALGERPELWRNLSPAGNHWIRLALEGTLSNRDGIGARVVVGMQRNEFAPGVGYASSSHAGLHFGLGSLSTIARIEVLWPSGQRQILENVSTNQILAVKEPSR